MDSFKRILAGIAIFASGLGLILSLAGVIAVWMVNRPLTDSLTGLLDSAEAVLIFSQDQLDEMDSDLAEIQEVIARVEQAVNQAGEQLAEGNLTLQLISNLVGEELAPKVESAAALIKTIRGTIISVDSTLTTANTIPFVTVPTLPMEQLAEIDQQMQAAVADARSLVETVNEIEDGVITQTGAAITAQTDRLDALVIQVRTPIGNFNARLADAETKVENAKARITALIDWVSILLTLLLLWTGLGQAALIFLGWYYWKTATIPVVPQPASLE
ncbi:MAG: hypothetical protein P8X95_08030 [Anaerolineales bacterium]|jgi:chromosome segregation ATPase